MIAVQGSEIQGQLDFARSCCDEKMVDRQKGADIYSYACAQNGVPGFGPIEADFLYCFIYRKRPKTIVQVGCGVSTAVILLAAHEAGYQPKIA